MDPLQSRVLSVDWVSALKEWIPRIEKAKPVDMSITVIQGESDGTVDWRHNVYMLNKKFREPAVFYIKGAEHHLVNESEEIREKIFAIIGRTFSEFLDKANVRAK
jgi:alpha-beta hydrolase superfamily lysophospholipase